MTGPGIDRFYRATTKLKYSKYNVEIPYDRRYKAVFNTFNRSVALIEEDLLEKLKEGESYRAHRQRKERINRNGNSCSSRS